MRGADGCSWKNDRPAGVALSFQVIEHSVEPIEANRCCNLLANNALRSTRLDETEEVRPEVALVELCKGFTGSGKRLTKVMELV